MLEHLLAEADPAAVPITALTEAGLDDWLAEQPARVAAWLRASGFRAKAGTHALLPGEDGGLARVLLGTSPDGDLWAYAGLPSTLPERRYRLEPEPPAAEAERAALGWALGAYAFTHYKAPARGFASLLWPAAAERAAVARAAEATALVRDLVNTPAADLGPAELAESVRAVGKRFGAKVTVSVGEQLLKRGYPSVHAVGRGSARAPRLIDLRWGRGDGGPQVTLVGKGVCFDTGGLDLKPAAAMKLMKKDMGGAAHALALAQMIMHARLPLRLRLLIPAVENSVSGEAFRPQDVVQTRKGLTVEVGNTDAEGRLVLADALAAAESEQPALLLDFATLTGAARTALGPDLPALFCNDEVLAEALLAAGREQQDPLWRLPLHAPYRGWLDSDVADLGNVAEEPYAGAVVAALFLAEFVPGSARWAHFDLFAWNPKARPGRPKGGEAMGLRAAFAALKDFVAESAAGSR